MTNSWRWELRKKLDLYLERLLKSYDDNESVSHKTDWICISVTLSDTFIGFMQHVGMCNKHEIGSFGKLSKMLLCLLACVCILLLVLLYMPLMIHYMLTVLSLHEVSWYKGVSIQTVPGILIWQIFLLDLDYWSVHRASFILFFNHLFFKLLVSILHVYLKEAASKAPFYFFIVSCNMATNKAFL